MSGMDFRSFLFSKRLTNGQMCVILCLKDTNEEKTMSIQQTIKVIYGAPLEGVNPLPRFRKRNVSISPTKGDFPDHLKEGIGFQEKVLPYTLQDRYSRKRIPLRLKCFVMENEYLKAEFLPEYGGRLYSLFDKKRNRDLVMKNPVIQPANLAIRNAWLSGGIEWNIGNIGHTYTTCDNVFAAILEDDKGSSFLRIYEFERLKSIFWQVDFHLPDDSTELLVHVRTVNPFPKDTTTYWWSNVAVPDDGKTRILASSKSIISFVDGAMMYERLPNIEAMPGSDVSYPSNATRSFDFFVQQDEKDNCTWEAAAYSDGVVLYERSTPPLSCKKLFCWGNHNAGKHWQEFLSDKGHGYYAEIQAGIAPSQLHDKKMKANSTIEWTQAFGGLCGDMDSLYNSDYTVAAGYLGGLIDSRMSEQRLNLIDENLKKLADLPVSESEILHTGSGFGALEAKRMAIDKDGKVPSSMCFPSFTMGKEQAPFLHLLKEGILPDESPRYYTPTYMISDKWIPRLKNSLDAPGGETWYSLLQYGIAVYENTDLSLYAKDSVTDEDNAQRADLAEKLWTRSLELCPSYLALRNLAQLEWQRGNTESAESYYDRAIAEDGAFDDFALAAEYMGFLVGEGKYQKLWSLYSSLPEECKKADRISIYAAMAAVKLSELSYLEEFFAKEHYDIREGECSLTDIWFEFCARKMARERGLDENDHEVISILFDEAWDTCPPSEDIDFRMSFDRKTKYRI